MVRRPPGALEQEVLAVLAAAGGAALTPARVRTELGEELAYTTVMTALDRLYKKGAITRERTGRGYAYRWTATGPPSVTARQMRRLLDRDRDRAAALAQFVAALDPADEATLAALLNESTQDRRT